MHANITSVTVLLFFVILMMTALSRGAEYASLQYGRHYGCKLPGFRPGEKTI